MNKLQRVFGPALIPNKKIYRNPNKAINEPHYIFFSEETIAKLRRKFHENNYDNNVNINHDGIQVDDVMLTKSFIVDKDNKSQLPSEFSHLPIGTWMVEYQIDNEEIWKMVEEKKLNGFSIEGLLSFKLQN